jgi:hypothetical protein
VGGLHDLDGDLVAKPQPSGPVDLAHPAGTQGPEDLVPVVDANAWGEHAEL